MNPRDEIRILAKVARLHYCEKFNQRNISKKLGISEASISRLLKQAHKKGIVKIVIDEPSNYSLIEAELEREWDLKEAILVPCSADDSVTKMAVGRATSIALSKHLRDKMSIGIAWGSTLLEVVNSLRPTALNGISVVQLIGGIGGVASVVPRVSATELAIKIAVAYGASLHTLDAPAIVSTKNRRSSFMEEESIKQTLDLAKKVDIALIGIGQIGSDSLLSRVGILQRGDVKILSSAKAVGDICCHFFDIEGRLIESPLEERVIGVSPGLLKRIKCVIAVATGRKKARAVLGALRTGVIDILVTDISLAEETMALRAAAFSTTASRKN